MTHKFQIGDLVQFVYNDNLLMSYIGMITGNGKVVDWYWVYWFGRKVLYKQEYHSNTLKLIS